MGGRGGGGATCIYIELLCCVLAGCLLRRLGMGSVVVASCSMNSFNGPFPLFFLPAVYCTDVVITILHSTFIVHVYTVEAL